MSGAVRSYVRQHHLALITLFLVLTGGTALANHPGGADTIDSGDVIDNSLSHLDLQNNNVRSTDIRNDDVAGGGLVSEDIAPDALTDGDIAPSAQFNGAAAGGDLLGSTFPNPELAPDTVTGAEVATDAVGLPEIATDGVGSSEIRTGAVRGSEVLDRSLTGIDIALNSVDTGEVDEPTLFNDNSLTGSDIDDSFVPTNSGAVDGLDATEIVVGASDTADTGQCTGDLADAFETCADTPVAFPHEGRALVVATAGWETTDEGIGSDSICHIQVDESNTIGQVLDIGVSDGGGNPAHPQETTQESVAIQAMTSVLPAGSHPFEFNCRHRAGGDSDIDQAYISVIAFPAESP